MLKSKSAMRTIIVMGFLLFLLAYSHGDTGKPLNWNEFLLDLAAGKDIEFARDINILDKSPIVIGADTANINGMGLTLNGNRFSGFELYNKNPLSFSDIHFTNFSRSSDTRAKGSAIYALNTSTINIYSNYQYTSANPFVEFENNSVNATSSVFSQAQGGAIFVSASTSGASAERLYLNFYSSAANKDARMNFFNNSAIANGIISQAQGGVIFAAGNTVESQDAAAAVNNGQTNISINNSSSSFYNNFASVSGNFSQAQGGVIFAAGSAALGITGHSVAAGEIIFSISTSNIFYANNSVSARNASAAQGGGLFLAGAVSNGSGVSASAASAKMFVSSSVIVFAANTASAGSYSQAQGAGAFFAGEAAGAGSSVSNSYFISTSTNNIFNFYNNTARVSGIFSQAQGGGLFIAHAVAGSSTTGSNLTTITGGANHSLFKSSSSVLFFSNNSALSQNYNSQAQGGGLFSAGIVLGANSTADTSNNFIANIDFSNSRLSSINNKAIASADNSQAQGGGLFISGIVSGGKDSLKSNPNSINSFVEFTIGDSTVSLSNNMTDAVSFSQSQGGGLFISGVVSGGAQAALTDDISGGSATLRVVRSSVSIMGNLSSSNQGTIYGGGSYIGLQSLQQIKSRQLVQAQGGGMFVAGVVANGVNTQTSASAGSVGVFFDSSIVNISNNLVMGANAQGGGIFIAGAVAGGLKSRAQNNGNISSMSFLNSQVNIVANKAVGSDSRGGGMFIGGAVSIDASNAADSGAVSVEFVNTAVNISSNSAKYGGGLYAVTTLGNGAKSVQNTTINFINSNVIFAGNTAQKGAAIYVDSYRSVGSGKVQIKFVAGTLQFLNNVSSAGNGVLFWDGENSIVDFSEAGPLTAIGNASINGGFLALDSTKKLLLSNAVILASNTAVGAGGALYITNSATITFINTTNVLNIIGNKAAAGGAIYIDGNASIDRVTIDGEVNISSNISTQGNGVISWNNNIRGDIPITFFGKITAYGNSASNGGLMYLNNNNLVFNQQLNVGSNTARGEGGAIFATNNSTISFNLASQVIFTGNKSRNGQMDNDIYLSNNSRIILNGDAANSASFLGGIYSINSAIVRNTGEVKLNLGGYNYFDNTVVELSTVTLTVGSQNTRSTFIYTNGKTFNIDDSTLTFYNSLVTLSNFRDPNKAVINVVEHISSITFVNSTVTFQNNTKAIYLSGASGAQIGSVIKFQGGQTNFISNRTASGAVIQWNNGALVTLGETDIYARYNSGPASGFLYLEGSVTSFSGAISMSNNASLGSGGAITLVRSTATFVGSGMGKQLLFTNNTAARNGGAISAQASSLTIVIAGDAAFSTAVFYGNTAGGRLNDLYLSSSSLNLITNAYGAAQLYSGINAADSIIGFIGAGKVNLSGQNTIERSSVSVYGNGVLNIIATGAGANFTYSKSIHHLEVLNSGLFFINSTVRFRDNNNAAAGGALEVVNSTLTFSGTNVNFTNNTSALGGGALNFNTQGAANTSAQLRFNNTQASFSDNKAAVEGGAIAISAIDDGAYNLALDFIVDSSVLNFNRNISNSSGGAIAVYLSASALPSGMSSLYTSISNSRLNFSNNISSAGIGGAFFNASSMSIINSQLTFTNNEAQNGGAFALYFSVIKSARITNSAFSFIGNKSTSSIIGGGAMMMIAAGGGSGSRIIFDRTNLNFRQNTADSGGALAAGVLQPGGGIGSINIAFNNSYVSFEYNKAASTGGAVILGIVDNSKVVTASNISFDFSTVTFIGNSAIKGGAAAIIRGSTMSFNDSTVRFENNTADLGGAVYMSIIVDGDNAPTLAFNNSRTVFANNIASSGAVIYLRRDTSADSPSGNSRIIFNGGSVDFVNNISSHGAGIIYFDDTIGGSDYGQILFENNVKVQALNNTAQNGGFLSLDSSSATDVSHSPRPRVVVFSGDTSIIGNRARQSGGAFYLTGNQTQFDNITFGSANGLTNTNISGNLSVSSGGAFYLSTDTGVNFDNTNLIASNNRSLEGHGGFIYAKNTDLKFHGKAAISQNSADLGGAIYLENSDSTKNQRVIDILSRADSLITFTGNVAKTSGGAVYLKGNAATNVSTISLNAQSGNIIFANNRMSSTPNDVYLDDYAYMELSASASSKHSVVLFSGVIANENTKIENLSGMNVLSGHLNLRGVLSVVSGTAAVSAYAGTTTYSFGQAGFINTLNVSAGASFFLNPRAGWDINGVPYLRQERGNSPRVLRTLVSGGAINGELAVGANTDNNSYGQLVIAQGGGTFQINSATTFTVVLQGYGATAGTFIVADGNQSLSSKINFSTIHVTSDGDYKLILLSTTSAEVDANNYYGRFAAIKYFDFDNVLRTLGNSQSETASAISNARKSGAINSNFVDALTRITAPGADPTGYIGRKTFDILSGSFIATVIKQSAANNTDALYSRINRVISKNSLTKRYEENIFESIWVNGSYGALQYNENRANPREFKSAIRSVQAGADKIISDNALAGVFVEYQNGDYEQGDDKANSKAMSIGLYGGYLIDAVNIKASLSFGQNDIKTVRKINLAGERIEWYNFPGVYFEPKANFSVYSLKYATEIEYIVIQSDEIDINPFIGLQGASIFNNEIKEKYGEDANLKFKADRYDRLVMTLGLGVEDNGPNFRWRGRIYGGYVMTGAKAEYKTEFIQLGESMNVNSVEEKDAFFGITAGTEYNFTDRVSAFVNLDFNKADDLTAYYASIGAGYKIGSKTKRIRERHYEVNNVEKQIIAMILRDKINDLINKEKSEGNGAISKEDAIKALDVKPGKNVYLTKVDNRDFYFDTREEADTFVKQLQAAGGNIDRSSTKAVKLDNSIIDMPLPAAARAPQTKKYNNGAVEVVGLASGGGRSQAKSAVTGDSLLAALDKPSPVRKRMEAAQAKAVEREARKEAKKPNIPQPSLEDTMIISAMVNDMAQESQEWKLTVKDNGLELDKEFAAKFGIKENGNIYIVDYVGREFLFSNRRKALIFVNELREKGAKISEDSIRTVKVGRGLVIVTNGVKMKDKSQPLVIEYRNNYAEIMTAEEKRVRDARRTTILAREAKERREKPNVQSYRMGVAIFELGKAVLKSSAKRNVRREARKLDEVSFNHITIEGHTDSTGSEEVNKRLSIKRAEAVYNEFLESGVPANKLSYVGLGSDVPIADNGTEAGRERNRRVEIYVE
ncbi:MAG: OmpA family protein [Elusimicrobiota bacterium]|jgi:predicted outer membrane repeat protein|nr:OmpA family protein [Elusimicrobiota bacterium]